MSFIGPLYILYQSGIQIYMRKSRTFEKLIGWNLIYSTNLELVGLNSTHLISVFGGCFLNINGQSYNIVSNYIFFITFEFFVLY